MQGRSDFPLSRPFPAHFQEDPFQGNPSQPSDTVSTTCPVTFQGSPPHAQNTSQWGWKCRLIGKKRSQSLSLPWQTDTTKALLWPLHQSDSYPSLTCEQNPKQLKLIHLKLLKFLAWRNKQKLSSVKSRDGPDPFQSPAAPRNDLHSNNEQKWWQRVQHTLGTGWTYCQQLICLFYFFFQIECSSIAEYSERIIKSNHLESGKRWSWSSLLRPNKSAVEQHQFSIERRLSLSEGSLHGCADLIICEDHSTFRLPSFLSAVTIYSFSAHGLWNSDSLLC